MEYFTEDQIHALRAMAEEHWSTFESAMLQFLTQEEFEDLCRKLGLEPEE